MTNLAGTKPPAAGSAAKHGDQWSAHPESQRRGHYFVESVNRNLVNPLLGWSQGHYLIYEQNGERRVSTVNDKPVTDVLSTQSYR